MTTAVCGVEYKLVAGETCILPFEPAHPVHRSARNYYWADAPVEVSSPVPRNPQARDEKLLGMAQGAEEATHAPEPERPSIFDIRAAAIARQSGINAADDHAKEVWKQDAYQAGLNLAGRLDYFTSDEVWEELQQSTSWTHEPAALGPVMLKLCRDGIIIKTDELVRTKIPRRHRDLVVWQSAIRIPKT